MLYRILHWSNSNYSNAFTQLPEGHPLGGVLGYFAGAIATTATCFFDRIKSQRVSGVSRYYMRRIATTARPSMLDKKR